MPHIFMARGGLDVDFLVFTDADIYFQYLRMRMCMLKIMWISRQDVDFLIFEDADTCRYLFSVFTDADVINNANADIWSISIHG